MELFYIIMIGILSLCGICLLWLLWITRKQTIGGVMVYKMKRRANIWGISGSYYNIDIWEHHDYHIEITTSDINLNQTSLHMSIEEAADMFNGDTGKELNKLYQVRKSEGQV